MVLTSAVVLLPLALTIVTQGVAQRDSPNDILPDDQNSNINTDFDVEKRIGRFVVGPFIQRPTNWEDPEDGKEFLQQQPVLDDEAKHRKRIHELVSTSPVTATKNKTEDNPDESKTHQTSTGSKSREIRPGQSEAADDLWLVQDRPNIQAVKRNVLTSQPLNSRHPQLLSMMMMKKKKRDLMVNVGHHIKRLIMARNTSSTPAFKTRKKAKELVRLVRLSPMMFFYRAPLVGGASALVENFPRLSKRSKKPPTFEIAKNPHKRRRFDIPQVECPPTSDGIERFSCPSPDRMGRYKCILDHGMCDGFIDCPNAEDEDRTSCMFYQTTKAHLDVLADALLRWARRRY